MPKKTTTKATSKAKTASAKATKKTVTKVTKPNLEKHHENFSKFLITVIIFLGIMVLILFSVLWDQMYENGDYGSKREKSSMMKYDK